MKIIRWGAMNNVGTYDTLSASKINLDSLLNMMERKGVGAVYIKRLSPNDNSKNQPYFGFHLTDLPFIPTGQMRASKTSSKKIKNADRSIKYQAPIKLNWMDADGGLYPAPHAKLIYYPQYPEVRFSGFLRGSKVDLSRWMSPDKEGRAEGRWLLLGVNPSEEAVYGYLAAPDSLLSKELDVKELSPASSIFGEIGVRNRELVKDTKAALLEKLLEIHCMGWVAGQKLSKGLLVSPYKAPNGGGYTLEALLGIPPNGIAEPDFLGWEVKQFGVKGFPCASARPTTLMTPEPNGGIYAEDGPAEFVKRFGYPDKSGKPDRLNFGGRHMANKVCAATGLTLSVDGFNSKSKMIMKADGAIALIDSKNTVAASWSFEKIMDHWKRKHSKAVYVPCMMRRVKSGAEYSYGKNIKLGTETNFEMFLSAMLDGFIYYDPGIKLEKASTNRPSLKRRSQFRVQHKNLGSLYKNLEFFDLMA